MIILTQIMEIKEVNGLKYYRFPGLAAFPEVVHGLFTRQGGVSDGPYASLNLSFTVGDDPLQVRENRRRLQSALGLKNLVSAVQVHGSNGALVSGDEVFADEEIPEADILYTQKPGFGLVIKQADCQAVLLYDPDKRVVANIHCGWRGQVQNILSKAVRRLRETFGVSPEALVAGIGPGLGPCCAEFRQFREEFPSEMWRYQVRPGYFDLYGLSRDQLIAAGLRKSQIEIAGLCTRCQSPEFFSYRRDRLTGRQGAVIALRD
jgi:YfiH family protein